MAFTTRYFIHTIVYWANPSTDGTGGYTFDTPVEITGRWETKSERFMDDRGEEHVSRSVVYVDRDVSVNEMLYLGSLSDLSVAEKAAPYTVREAYPIRHFGKVPSVSGAESLRKVML